MQAMQGKITKLARPPYQHIQIHTQTHLPPSAVQLRVTDSSPPAKQEKLVPINPLAETGHRLEQIQGQYLEQIHSCKMVNSP